MTDNEFEQATIAAAMKGDAEAGMEALRIFITGCDSGTLSRQMLDYVKERLANIVFDGIEPAVALCVFQRKVRDVEYPPEEVAACYFLLRRRGLTPGNAKAAMQTVFVRRHKSISARQIETTAKCYAPMESFDDETLRHMTGTKRKQIAKLIAQSR